MNASLKVVLLSICLVTFYTFAKGNANQKEESLASLVATGTIAKIKPLFSDRLQVNIGSEGRIYSAQQASVILEDFFAKNPPLEFQNRIKGGKESKMYIIGTLVTDSGKYNLSIFYTHFEGKKKVIQQIRIDEHED